MADKKISALTSAATPLAGTEVLPIVQSGSTVKVTVSDLTDGRVVTATDFTARKVTGGRLVLDSTTTGTTNTILSVLNNGAALADLNYSAKAHSWTYGATQLASTDQNGTYKIFTNGTECIRVSINDMTNYKGNYVVGTAGKGIDFGANTHSAGMTSELLNDYEEGTFTPTLSGATTTTYTTQTGRYTKIGRQVFFQCEIEINSVGNGSTTIVLLGDLPTAAVFSTISVGFFNAVATSVTSLTGYIGAAGGNSVQFQSLAAAGTNTTANAIFQNGARVIFSGQYSV